MLKKLFVATILTGINIAFVGFAEAATLTDLEGDKDCFGSNKLICNTISVNEINGAGESGSNFDSWDLNLFTWTHSFTLSSGSVITDAKLTIPTFDIEDNGAGDGQGGQPFDTRLFIDGIEFAGAFDLVFTPDGTLNTQLPVNTVVFDFNQLLLDELMDEEINVSINPRGGSRKDSIAVDYAELEITFEDEKKVPEPTSLITLFMLGIAGIGSYLKRKYNFL